MLELYHNDMSVCAAKVRSVLAEKKLEWRGIHMDLRAGDTQKPEYMKLNPNAVVPTLVHDRRVLIESTVICEYLDDAFPRNPLMPEDPFARARMRLWTKQLDEGLHAAVGTLSFCIAFRHQFLCKSPEEIQAYLAGVPSPEARERRQKGIELGMDSPGFAPALKKWDSLLGEVEKTLEKQPWLAGESYSLAEVGYAPYMIRLEHLGLESLWRNRPRVSEWRSRLFARPSYKEAVEKWFNPKYLEIFEAQRPAVRQRMSAL